MIKKNKELQYYNYMDLYKDFHKQDKSLLLIDYDSINEKIIKKKNEINISIDFVEILTNFIYNTNTNFRMCIVLSKDFQNDFKNQKLYNFLKEKSIEIYHVYNLKKSQLIKKAQINSEIYDHIALLSLNQELITYLKGIFKDKDIENLINPNIYFFAIKKNNLNL